MSTKKELAKLRAQRYKAKTAEAKAKISNEIKIKQAFYNDLYR